MSLGHNTIHVIPIVKGEVMKQDIKRINVGGSNVFDTLYRNLNLKYPSYKSKLSQNYIQAILESMCFVASNYDEQLKYFQHGKNIFDNSAYKNRIQYENNIIALEESAKLLKEPTFIDFPAAQPVVSNKLILKFCDDMSSCPP